MSGNTDRLLDKEIALQKFNEWLQSQKYIPDEISKGIKATISFYVLPLCDLTYKFKNKWQAEIGTFQKGQYESARDKAKKRAEEAKRYAQQHGTGIEHIRQPKESDQEFWVWSYGQDTYEGVCSYGNKPIFSFAKSGLDTKILDFVRTHAGSVFSHIGSKLFEKDNTETEQSDKEILVDNLVQCKNDARNSKTPYPGDKKRKLETKIDILGYTITRKYLPVYKMEYIYKNKTFSNYSDAVVGKYYTGSIPQVNRLDEIIAGIIGAIFFLLYFYHDNATIQSVAQKLSIQSSSILFAILISGLTCVGYLLYSYNKEHIKVYQRKKTINENKDTNQKKSKNIIIQNIADNPIGVSSFIFGLISVFFISSHYIVPLALVLGIIGMFINQWHWSISGIILATIGLFTPSILSGLITLTSIGMPKTEQTIDENIVINESNQKHINDKLMQDTVEPDIDIKDDTTDTKKIQAPKDNSTYFGVVGVKSNDVLNMRIKPNYKTTLVAKIPHDATCLEEIEVDINSGKTGWMKVRYKNNIGWVSVKFLELDDRCP